MIFFSGISQELLNRLSVIVRALNSRREIYVEAYRDYAKETNQIYRDNYNWYKITQTLRKLLVHGPEIIVNFLVPCLGCFLRRRKSLLTTFVAIRACD